MPQGSIIEQKSTKPDGPAVVVAVVIGRNEGDRLRTCLTSLASQTRRVVYVDSGSTDGSVDVARSLGADVAALDLARPFTAARARNAGLSRLSIGSKAPDFVQFVDGDCAVDPQWIQQALRAFARHPEAVVVCGRRREKFPAASVYNRLCDREWNTPIGPALSCGGDAMMRYPALTAVGGYREDLIAGEEPELCIRLRQNGGTVWRIDAEMTLHDAAITRFGQFWKRSKRAGHAFAEGAALHGAPPERHWVLETRRTVFWGAIVPAAAGLGALLVHPILIALLLLWPLQVLRLGLAWRHEGRVGWEAASMWVPAKLAEAQGALGYWLARLQGKRRGLIEYK